MITKSPSRAGLDYTTVLQDQSSVCYHPSGLTLIKTALRLSLPVWYFVPGHSYPRHSGSSNRKEPRIAYNSFQQSPVFTMAKAKVLGISTKE